MADVVSSIGTPRPTPRDGAHAGAALWVVLSGVAAVVAGPLTLSLLREQLHVGCGTGSPGSEGAGAWTCADGIGYLWWAVVLGGMTLVIVLVGAAVALLVRRPGAARAVLTLLACVSVGWGVAWTSIGSSRYVWSVPAGVGSLDYWVAAVGPAAIVAAVALLLGFLALGSASSIGRALGAAAIGGLIVATILQPGLGISTLPAVGLLGGAIARRP